MADIFIGYASEDRSRVKALAEALEQQGWSVWWDWKSIPVGKTWRQAIEEGLEAARSILVLWSSESIGKDWVIDEADFGKERKILVPVIIDDVRPPIGHRQIQAASLIEWQGEVSHTGFRQIKQALISILGNPEPEETKGLIGPAEQMLSEPPETFSNSIGMKFVLIPMGGFMMGNHVSPEETNSKLSGILEWNKHKRPQHKVLINKSFYLQTTAVTVGQWRMFIKETDHKTEAETDGGITILDGLEWKIKKVANWDNPEFSQDDRHPVTCVSWRDVLVFIRWLNRLKDTNKYRLPSEAEWEYACRAGTLTEFSFGDNMQKLGKYAWYEDNSKGQTHPAGKKKPNPWGLYDMNGNVREWVEDDWHLGYNGAPDDGHAWIDEPRGPYRVLRGGSWRGQAHDCRSDYRSCGSPNNRNNDIGFRLVWSVALGA